MSMGRVNNSEANAVDGSEQCASGVCMCECACFRIKEHISISHALTTLKDPMFLTNAPSLSLRSIRCVPQSIRLDK